MKHILAPVDGSDISLRAVELAADLAKRYDAKLTILVVREFLIARGGAMDIISKDDAADFLRAAKDAAAKAGYKEPELRDIHERIAPYAIVAFAEKNGVDHIVLGSQGKGAIKKFLLGSVSGDVASQAHCAVTIVH